MITFKMKVTFKCTRHHVSCLFHAIFVTTPRSECSYSPLLDGWDSRQIYSAVCPKTHSQQVTSWYLNVRCLTLEPKSKSAIHTTLLHSLPTAFVTQTHLLPWTWARSLRLHPAALYPFTPPSFCSCGPFWSACFFWHTDFSPFKLPGTCHFLRKALAQSL